jgi:hypothetical protein
MTELAFPAGAVWIGSDHPFDLHEAYLCFRKSFSLESPPVHAQLLISADSRYKLWVNGRFVARGPARSYPHAQCVDGLDLAPYLQSEHSLIAMQVYQPGYSHFAYVHRAAAGLLACLLIDDRPTLHTDTTWRVKRDPSFAANVSRVSIYGSGVEDRDLRLAEPWQSADYDDSGWAQARVAAPLGGYPWTGLQLRSLPLLMECETPLTLIETRRGPTDFNPDPHLALRAGWFAAAPASIAADADGWYSMALNPGESAYWLFDLGRDSVSAGWAEIEDASGRETLLVQYADRIRNGQLVISDPQTYCRVRMTDRFRLRAGDQQAETFSLRGGRYLLFQLAGPASLRLRFHARIAEYPLAITTPLQLADPHLAQIAKMCEDTFRACLLDGFVDSAWRESSQWLGDALPQALIMASLTEDARPLRRVIEMAAQGAYPDGILPGVLPGEAHAYTVLDYNFIWIELLNLYWTLTRDGDFVTQMWPTLLKLLDRFHRDLDSEGLLISQPGHRLFLDWAPLSRNEPNAVYNLHYLLALRVALRLAQEREVSDCVAAWQKRVRELRSAIRTAFWDGGAWRDDVERTTFSQLAAALAVLSGATEPPEDDTLLEAIAARSLDPDDSPAPGKMVLASPFMHHYLFEALRRGARSDQVIEIIRLRWGRWVEAGFPTAWENWNVDFPDGSQCHAFSAHPLYHLAQIIRTPRPDRSLVNWRHP